MAVGSRTTSNASSWNGTAGQRIAKIETTGGLSGNLKARVRADLVRIYGPALRISFVQSPALIGGMRITVGSDLYDGSVRGTLAALEGAHRDR